MSHGFTFQTLLIQIQSKPTRQEKNGCKASRCNKISTFSPMRLNPAGQPKMSHGFTFQTLLIQIQSKPTRQEKNGCKASRCNKISTFSPMRLNPAGHQPIISKSS